MTRADAALGERHVEALFQRVVEGLRTSELRSPSLGESETRYTARVLLPWLRALMRDVGLDGLLVAGDGGKSVEAARLLGRYYNPDLTVHFHRRPLIAVEVKLADCSGFQYSLCTAIGQSIVYRQRYDRSLALVIDMDAVSSREEAVEAADIVRTVVGTELVVRRQVDRRIEPLGK